ncbi:hypothetical protein DRO32_05300 [Candidatus Bathyarchaeota archaeon]|nr:MAG: hypothetical protein DRO32_05300 [Candidatus Bathyarchaeota archaeon]
MSTVKVGKLRVKVPEEARVVEAYDLDEVFACSSQRPDTLIILEVGQKMLAVVVEDTGRPELKDLRRLSDSIGSLKERGLVEPRMMVLKVLHHTGLKSGRSILVELARRFRVELQECHHTPIDLDQILRKRGMLLRIR